MNQSFIQCWTDVLVHGGGIGDKQMAIVRTDGIKGYELIFEERALQRMREEQDVGFHIVLSATREELRRMLKPVQTSIWDGR